MSDRNHEHESVLWALVFFMLEHVDDCPLFDPEKPTLLDAALALVATPDTSPTMHAATILHVRVQ